MEYISLPSSFYKRRLNVKRINQNLPYIILSIASFILAFSSYFNSDPIFKAFQFSSIILANLIIIYILTNSNSVNYNKIDLIFDVLIAFLLIFLFYSSYINRNNHIFTHSFLNSLIFIFMVLTIIFSYFYLIKSGKGKLLIKTYLFLITILCIVNDIMILLKGSELKLTQQYLFSGFVFWKI